MIKYHRNHFEVASLAHNKKKAIQGWRDRLMLCTGNKRILKVYHSNNNKVMHSNYVGDV